MLSVVICTHNPRSFLGRVLEALRAQTLPFDEWELLVVDNASSKPIAGRFDISWHPNGRHISEHVLGTAYARQRGIKRSKGSVIVFVDDDNLVRSDYLETAIKIGEDHPELGTWGSGTINPEFEIEPAQYLVPYLQFLALRNNERSFFSTIPSLNDATPLGAGLCVRRSVAEAYLKFYRETKIKLTDRAGNSLGGGADYEISFVGCSIGFGMGVFPELRMIHIIPKERIREDYFIGLLGQTKFTISILDYKWRNIRPRTWGLLSYWKAVLTRHGFDRKLYFAKWRGMAEAKKIANSHQGP